MGLSLTLTAALLRREKFHSRLSGAQSKSIAAAAIITLLTLLVLEIVLTLWGMPTYFPSVLRGTELRIVPHKVCDERGCRLNLEGINTSCAKGERSGRYCIVNQQGYPDTDDFVVREDFAQRTRILTMGDSFTHGYSAEPGKSFVEFLEISLPEAIIWNLGVTATGTTQDLQAFVEYAPILKPQLSILGFYMNDFVDNLRDRRVSVQLQDSDGITYFMRYAPVDRWGNPFTLSDEVI